MDRVTRLITEAHRVIEILDEAGEKIWTEKWRRIIALLDAKKTREGIEYLMVLYGGTGTMKDFMISPMNGHTVSAQEAEILNQDLTFALSDVYGTANQLKEDIT